MKKPFTITCPPQSIMVALAVGIVHGAELGWLAFFFLVLVGTIVENFS